MAPFAFTAIDASLTHAVHAVLALIFRKRLFGSPSVAVETLERRALLDFAFYACLAVVIAVSAIPL